MPADSSEQAYKKVVDTMVKVLSRGASGAGFGFDGEDMTEFYKNMADRKKIVASLKKKMGKGEVKASDWCLVMAKVDHMSRIDRDLQMRFRTRIGAFRRRSLAGGNGIAALLGMRSVIEKAQK
jgi:hypothetical protein